MEEFPHCGTVGTIILESLVGTGDSVVVVSASTT